MLVRVKQRAIRALIFQGAGARPSSLAGWELLDERSDAGGFSVSPADPVRQGQARGASVFGAVAPARGRMALTRRKGTRTSWRWALPWLLCGFSVSSA